MAVRAGDIGNFQPPSYQLSTCPEEQVISYHFASRAASSGGGRGVKIKAQIIGVGTSKLSVIGSLDEQVISYRVIYVPSPAVDGPSSYLFWRVRPSLPELALLVAAVESSDADMAGDHPLRCCLSRHPTELRRPQRLCGETLARPLASLTCPCLTLSLSAYTPRARRLAACIAGDVQLGVRLAHGSETRRLSWNASARCDGRLRVVCRW